MRSKKLKELLITVSTLSITLGINDALGAAIKIANSEPASLTAGDDWIGNV